MKTTDDIIAIVCSLVGGLGIPVYRTSAPDFTANSMDRPAEYIVINSLPINADVMQKCYVNVNYHVQELSPGIANLSALMTGATNILAILQKVSTTTYLIDFESQETFRENDEFFTNLRFSFKYINT